MSAVESVSVERGAKTGKRVGGASLRMQAGLSLLLLVAFCMTFAALAAAARLSPVIANHVAREEALQRLTDGIFLYDAGYVDDADYVLVEQLQRDNHRSGGVYFIGSSQTRTAIMPWRLPAGEREFIHNYSIGDLRHGDLRFYIRALVEEHGLLRAGGENVTLFLELSPAMARPKDYAAVSYVSHVFTRHQLYTYDEEQGIHRVRMSPIEKFLRLQRIHVHRFLRILFGAPSRVKLFTPEQQSPAPLRLEPDWRPAMMREVDELAATIDYLQARNVHVRAIFPPSGSWIEALPYEAAYREAVLPVVAARGVPVIDRSDLLQDYEFGDDWHPTYSGQQRLHEADRALALEALQQMGISPAP